MDKKISKVKQQTNKDNPDSNRKSKRPFEKSDFEAELLKKPEIRREYEALKPKYEMIKTLIERRNQLRISQTQLAKTIGTKQPAISRLERGDYNTRVGTFLKVVQALNLDLQVLPKSPEVRRGEFTRA